MKTRPDYHCYSELEKAVADNNAATVLRFLRKYDFQSSDDMKHVWRYVAAPSVSFKMFKTVLKEAGCSFWAFSQLNSNAGSPTALKKLDYLLKHSAPQIAATPEMFRLIFLEGERMPSEVLEQLIAATHNNAPLFSEELYNDLALAFAAAQRCDLLDRVLPLANVNKIFTHRLLSHVIFDWRVPEVLGEIEDARARIEKKNLLKQVEDKMLPHSRRKL